MKPVSFFLLVSTGLVFFPSCRKVVGEGAVVTETRSVNNFKGVSMSIGGTLHYKIDPVYKVEVQAQQNIIDVLKTDLAGDELVITYEDGVWVRDHEDVVVNISAPYADFVNLSGSGQFSFIGALSNTNCDLRISGSGNITIPEAEITNGLKATISGSGNISVLSGTIKNENLEISGTGNLELASTIAENATAKISGSGDMRVNLTKNLDATISGSGSIFYYGNPIISAHISGSGKLRPM